MKHIKLSFWGFLIMLSGLWLLVDPLLVAPYQFYPMRLSLINYTGIIGIGVMSVAMMMAIRPVFLESYLGGLDKMYRLHKWLGITGLVFSVAHWLWTKAPQWLIELGWMTQPARNGSPDQPALAFEFLRSQRGLAHVIGEWAFYAAVILIVLALVKRFPYRYFFKTHRLLAIVYLFLVFHSVVLMKFIYWNELIAPAMMVLMFGGSLAAFSILFKKTGRSRQVVGLVDKITHHQSARVLEVALQLKDRWSGHHAGQFAFVTFDEDEGPHPYTISSSWKGDGHMLFLIKELGDYTKSLAATLKVGDVVKVEGPYGQFNFNSNKTRQIWVAAGIGIAPFISRMKKLAHQPDGKIIDLFYTTSMSDEKTIAKLRLRAHDTNIRLHLLTDAKDGRLNAQRICQTVPEWLSGDIWFCGPVSLGQALRRDFYAKGLPKGDFHQELFHLR
jgi:predicted ferric reductase